MVVNVRELGAVGDGITLDTQAIQAAINKCHDNNGGKVIVENGNYLIGTIRLLSNVELYIDESASLIGVEDLDQYYEVKYLFQDGCNETTQPEKKGYCLIYAHEASNISITGNGTINGNGLLFKDKIKRPFLIRLIESNNILVKDVNMRNAGAWCFHLQRSKDINVSNISLENKYVRNGDGIDIDSCQNVVIDNCVVDTDDDAVCLKTTSFMPCDNITITNCTLSSECAGVKFGSESAGDFTNVVVRNNVIKECGVSAIKITPVDGGNVNNVLFENNEIINCTGPIFISTGARHNTFIEDKPRDNISQIENMKFLNMDMTTKRFVRRGLINYGQGVVVNGRPDSIIKNITFENLNISFWGEITDSYLSKDEVPILENQYPECYKLGILPSYGYFIRFTENVEINNCTHSLINKDSREYMIRINEK